MNLIIREIDRYSEKDLGACDSSFLVTSKLVLNTKNGTLRYRVVDVPSYTKVYDRQPTDLTAMAKNPDETIFFAYVDEEIAGEIHLEKFWNGYAYIADLVVDTKFRRQGVGRALLKQAITWAREKGFPGVMLETQDNNVGACRFYESCGFELRGFDTHLYKAMNPATDEIALYWYLIF